MMEVDTKEEGKELGFPYWKPIRRRFSPESLFFASGNIERELLAKHVALDLTEHEKHQLQVAFVDDKFREVFCPIVGCEARLMSLEGFEEHYTARHTACCSVCSRVFPTSRLLSLHVSETHDSFFQAKAARGYPMYECLVESCGLKFKSYKARHHHLVDKHKFPSSFEFFKRARPSKKARQRKQATQKQEEASSKMEVEGEAIDSLVSAVSKLSTSDSSPSSISFGRQHTRGLTFVPRAVQREKRIEPNPTGANK